MCRDRCPVCDSYSCRCSDYELRRYREDHQFDNPFSVSVPERWRREDAMERVECELRDRRVREQEEADARQREEYEAARRRREEEAAREQEDHYRQQEEEHYRELARQEAEEFERRETEQVQPDQAQPEGPSSC